MSQTNRTPGVTIGSSAARARSLRLDGFSDLFGGGSVKPTLSGDNRLYSNMTRYWNGRANLTDNATVYINNGIASTIVDKPADDCFARGFEIEGDDDDLMMDQLDRLSVESTFADAIRWARLFGASVIVLLAKDGGDWADPLNVDTLETIEDLIIYDVRHIKPTDRLYTDPTNPMFGKPEFFTIHPPGADSYVIHETRLIPFGGEPLPKSQSHRSNVWWLGKSVLDSCIDDLRRLDHAMNWTAKLLERKQQGIYKMEGLGELFAQNMDDIVAKRINNIDLVRNNLNSIVVDASDDYTVENLGLDGLQSVIVEFETAVCASAQMPSVILFGKSAGTLNATGAGELENYFSLVLRIQKRIAAPALERLISILWMQTELKGSIPDNWEVEFEPLWQPTEKEQAETKNLEATATNTEVTMLLTLIDAGILLPEEVRKIIVNRYSEFDFPETADLSLGGDAEYASSVGGGEDKPPGATDETA